MKGIVWVGLIIFLAGCQSQMSRQEFAVDSCIDKTDRQQNMQLALIEQLLDSQQYYSALAHLDELNSQDPRAIWLRAESLRKTGEWDQATQQYTRLTETCLAALGYQGIGKLRAANGDFQSAARALLDARNLAPTDASIRNDYGFALLAAGDLNNAVKEFQTAIELKRDHPVAGHNLILALLLQGDESAAMAAAGQYGISETEFNSIDARRRQYQTAGR